MIAKGKSVQTPIGVGVVQSHFFVSAIRDGQLVSHGVLVRLPINDMTRAHMKKSNCVTQNAKHSGLWVFSEGELK